ncbi:ribosome recycling factor [Candidatus Roizmanbacteria bacterium]|jgi:ribosome recycling factor|nr:ribosome recycling factor [Candidatus Roizmanbacteria bacterium]
MHPIIADFKQNSQKIFSSLKENLKTVRTGRASPSLVENLMVETYGGQAKLRLFELASITTDGPTVIAILPFDPSVISDIEKAILKSPLGLSPQTQGNRILLRLPPLSEEQREKMTKLVGQMIEEKKNHIRSLRDDARKKIKLMFEKKEITEDDKYRLEKEIDNENQINTEEIQKIKENKDKEIHEV